jgi:hypothetical protein
MKWSKPKLARPQTPGHYRPPQMKLPGQYNAPGRGRVGKQMPPLKKLNSKKKNG